MFSRQLVNSGGEETSWLYLILIVEKKVFLAVCVLCISIEAHGQTEGNNDVNCTIRMFKDSDTITIEPWRQQLFHHYQRFGCMNLPLIGEYSMHRWL
jgi:hypothetical protein